jgi:hypothetical protein
MNKKLSCAILVSIFGSFMTPVSAFEVLGSVKLEPMEKPSPRNSGTEFHWLRDGKEHTVIYESVDAELTKERDSTGCSRTVMTDMFAPAIAFENCSGSTGTQKITKTKGSPWPLSVKSEFQYNFSGQSAGIGKPWSSSRKCKVKGQDRVKVPAGEYDTYKLECKDTWNERTYWVSPELGYQVAFKRKHKRDKNRSYMLELVKVVNP